MLQIGDIFKAAAVCPGLLQQNIIGLVSGSGKFLQAVGHGLIIDIGDADALLSAQQINTNDQKGHNRQNQREYNDTDEGHPHSCLKFHSTSHSAGRAECSRKRYKTAGGYVLYNKYNTIPL